MNDKPDVPTPSVPVQPVSIPPAPRQPSTPVDFFRRIPGGGTVYANRVGPAYTDPKEIVVELPEVDDEE